MYVIGTWTLRDPTGEQLKPTLHTNLKPKKTAASAARRVGRVDPSLKHPRITNQNKVTLHQKC